MKLSLIGFQSYAFHFLQMFLLIPMDNEGIKNLDASIFLAGVLTAKYAVFYTPMIQTATSNAAGLIPVSSPTAWAVMPDIHDAEAAVQSTKGKKRICSAEVFQPSLLLKISQGAKAAYKQL